MYFSTLRGSPTCRLATGDFFCAFDLASCALHNEKSGVFAHANDRRLREGSLLYCSSGKNVVYLKGSGVGRGCRAEGLRGNADAVLLRTKKNGGYENGLNYRHQGKKKCQKIRG